MIIPDDIERRRGDATTQGEPTDEFNVRAHREARRRKLEEVRLLLEQESRLGDHYLHVAVEGLIEIIDDILEETFV